MLHFRGFVTSQADQVVAEFFENAVVSFILRCAVDVWHVNSFAELRHMRTALLCCGAVKVGDVSMAQVPLS